MKNDEIILAITDVDDLKVKDDEFWGNAEGFIIKTTKQEIMILISNQSSCCEHWGHFSTNDSIDDFLGASIKNIRLTDTALNTAIIEKHCEYRLDCGEIQFVDLETDRGILQFAVYNIHNGYYGHSILIKSNQVNHKGYL